MTYLMIESKILFKARKRQAAAKERYLALQKSQPFEGKSADQVPLVQGENVLVQNRPSRIYESHNF